MQKGSRHTDESRALLRAARYKQGSLLIGRHGITQEIYDAAMREGLQWCYVCKKFLHPAEFGAVQVRCSACIRAISAETRSKRSESVRRRQNEYSREWRSSKPEHVRRTELAKKYDVTPEWYEKTLAAQGGHCALCQAKYAHPGSKRVLFVDHSHTTGIARGILCAKCNTHLGIIEADPTWQDRALAYLAT